jgi:hypothetical protein
MSTAVEILNEREADGIVHSLAIACMGYCQNPFPPPLGVFVACQFVLGSAKFLFFSHLAVFAWLLFVLVPCLGVFASPQVVLVPTIFVFAPPQDVFAPSLDVFAPSLDVFAPSQDVFVPTIFVFMPAQAVLKWQKFALFARFQGGGGRFHFAPTRKSYGVIRNGFESA